MAPVDSPERPGTTAAGRLSRALLRMLMKRASVVTSEPVADGFRLITLEGAALKGVEWTAGQRIQIAMNSLFIARTYTPIEWSRAAGRTCIVAYAHGDGPGSAWVRSVQPGDECDIFGPRRSLDLRHINGPLAVFGDETSIGLAYALVRQDRSRSAVCYFEVGDRESAAQLVAQLQIETVTLFERRNDNGHVAEMEAALPPLVGAGRSFVLTGQAGTIQRLRQGLKRQAVPATRIVTKAYWAPGKTGLD